MLVALVISCRYFLKDRSFKLLPALTYSRSLKVYVLWPCMQALSVNM